MRNDHLSILLKLIVKNYRKENPEKIDVFVMQHIHMFQTADHSCLDQHRSMTFFPSSAKSDPLIRDLIDVLPITSGRTEKRSCPRISTTFDTLKTAWQKFYPKSLSSKHASKYKGKDISTTQRLYLSKKMGLSTNSGLKIIHAPSKHVYNDSAGLSAEQKKCQSQTSDEYEIEIMSNFAKSLTSADRSHSRSTPCELLASHLSCSTNSDINDSSSINCGPARESKLTTENTCYDMTAEDDTPVPFEEVSDIEGKPLKDRKTTIITDSHIFQEPEFLRIRLKKTGRLSSFTHGANSKPSDDCDSGHPHHWTHGLFPNNDTDALVKPSLIKAFLRNN